MSVTINFEGPKLLNLLDPLQVANSFHFPSKGTSDNKTPLGNALKVKKDLIFDAAIMGLAKVVTDNRGAIYQTHGELTRITQAVIEELKTLTASSNCLNAEVSKLNASASETHKKTTDFQAGLDVNADAIVALEKQLNSLTQIFGDLDNKISKCESQSFQAEQICLQYQHVKKHEKELSANAFMIEELRKKQKTFNDNSFKFNKSLSQVQVELALNKDIRKQYGEKIQNLNEEQVAKGVEIDGLRQKGINDFNLLNQNMLLLSDRNFRIEQINQCLFLRINKKISKLESHDNLINILRKEQLEGRKKFKALDKGLSNSQIETAQVKQQARQNSARITKNAKKITVLGQRLKTLENSFTFETQECSQSKAKIADMSQAIIALNGKIEAIAVKSENNQIQWKAADNSFTVEMKQLRRLQEKVETRLAGTENKSTVLEKFQNQASTEIVSLQSDLLKEIQRTDNLKNVQCMADKKLNQLLDAQEKINNQAALAESKLHMRFDGLEEKTSNLEVSQKEISMIVDILRAEFQVEIQRLEKESGSRQSQHVKMSLDLSNQLNKTKKELSRYKSEVELQRNQIFVNQKVIEKMSKVIADFIQSDASSRENDQKKFSKVDERLENLEDTVDDIYEIFM